jgi:hypothetical protein
VPYDFAAFMTFHEGLSLRKRRHSSSPSEEEEEEDDDVSSSIIRRESLLRRNGLTAFPDLSLQDPPYDRSFAAKRPPPRMPDSLLNSVEVRPVTFG